MKIEIVKCVNSGKGLGFKNNKAVFVSYALPGEIVEVEIISEKKDYCIAKIKNYIKQRENKQEPDCKYFLKCNGCCFQHISYEEELKLKQNIIEEILKKKKLKVGKVYEIIKSISRYNYRRKISINFREDKNIKKAGYFIEKTQKIFEIENCKLASKKIYEVLDKTIKYFYDLPFYNEKDPGRESIKNIIVSEYLEGLGIIIDHNFKKLPSETLEFLIENHYITIAEFSKNFSTNILYGKKKLKINDQIEKSPISFMQINAYIAKKIQNYLEENIKDNNYLYDLYCGVGFFSLFLSDKFKKLIGFDSSPRAVMDAVYNSLLLDIKNTTFYNLNDREISLKLLKKDSTVIIDPPRTGINKSLLKTLVKKRVENIFYISCDLSTMVRDLKFFQDNNYLIKEIKPFDMFPLTPHVECVTLLSIK